MNRIIKTAAAAAFALAVGLGVRASQAAAISVNGGSTSTPAIDGWYVAPQVGIDLLNISASGSTLVIGSKNANFPNSLSMAVSFFNPSATSTITQVEIQGENVFNGSSQTWNGFNFGLATTNGGPATFASVVGGSGAFYSPTIGGVATTGTQSLSADKESLDYTFTPTQGPGSSSYWGTDVAPSGDGSYLLIDLNGATGFTLEELPVVGTSVIPLPAAIWQSLVGLLGLGAIALTRKFKNQQA